MAFHAGAIEGSLAAAIGDDQALIADLRHAFFESARRHVVTLKAASTAAEVHGAAVRLRGLAASFGAERLMAVLAPVVAAQTASRDDLRRIDRVIALMKAR